MKKTTLKFDYARVESVRASLEVLAEDHGFTSTRRIVSAGESERKLDSSIVRWMQSPGEAPDCK